MLSSTERMEMITEEDCYPKYVCDGCLLKLKASLTFKRKCEHTDMKFRQIVQPEYRPSDPANFQRHDFTLFLQQMLQQRSQRAQIEFQREKRKLKKRPRKLVNQFKCVSCDIPFFDREKLDAHREERACARRPCPRCGALVLNVTLHVRRVHRAAAAAACPVCGRRARNVASLKAHMLLHSERYDYPCELCPYRGKRRAYLALHMRTHTGERPYLCASCPLTFTNASNLRKHALVHCGKPFQCPKCNKLFRSAKSLREHDDGYHLKILHPCASCGKTFTYRSLLLRHERKVHHRARASAGGAAPAPSGPGDEVVDDAGYDVPIGTYLQFRNTSQHSQVSDTE